MTQEEQDYTKGERLLGRCGLIQKIGVYCYEIEICKFEYEGSYYKYNKENLIVIGNNKDELEKTTKNHYNDNTEEEYDYKLEGEYIFFESEIIERFGLRKNHIKSILEGVNLKMDNYDLKETDCFTDCKLSIEELRKKRGVDLETFDSDDIMSKIASDYILTPKRKEALIKSIQKLK